MSNSLPMRGESHLQIVWIGVIIAHLSLLKRMDGSFYHTFCPIIVHAFCPFKLNVVIRIVWKNMIEIHSLNTVVIFFVYRDLYFASNNIVWLVLLMNVAYAKERSWYIKKVHSYDYQYSIPKETLFSNENFTQLWPSSYFVKLYINHEINLHSR